MPTAHPEQPSWLHSQPMLQAIAAPRLLLQPAGLAYHGALPGLAYVTHGGQPELLWHQPGPAAFPLYWPALPNPFAYSAAGAAAAASLQAPRLTFVPLAEAHEWHAAQQHGNTASSAGKGISLAPTSSSGEQPAASAIEGCPSERRSPATAHTAVGTASAAAACPITVEVRQVSGHPPAQHMTAAPRALRTSLEGTTAAAAALAARLLGMEEFAPGPDGGAAAQRAAAGRRLLTAAEQMPGGLEWEEPVPVDDLFGPDDSWLRAHPGTPGEVRPSIPATPGNPQDAPGAAGEAPQKGTSSAGQPPHRRHSPPSAPQHPAGPQPAMHPPVSHRPNPAEAPTAAHIVSQQHLLMQLLARQQAAAQPVLSPRRSPESHRPHHDDAEEAAADTAAALHALDCADLGQATPPAAVPCEPCGAAVLAAQGGIMIWPPSMQRPSVPSAGAGGWPQAMPPSAFASAAHAAEPETEAVRASGRRSTRARRVSLRVMGSAAGEAAVEAGRSSVSCAAALHPTQADGAGCAASPSPAAGGSPAPARRAAHLRRLTGRNPSGRASSGGPGASGAGRKRLKHASPSSDQAGRSAKQRRSSSTTADETAMAAADPPGGSFQGQVSLDLAAAALGSAAFPLFVMPGTCHAHDSQQPPVLPLVTGGYHAAAAGLQFAAAACQAGALLGATALPGGSLTLHTPPQLLKTSSFRGVSWCKRRLLWEAAISINGKRERLGFYRQEEAAARAYDLVAAWRNRDIAAERRSRAAEPRRRRRSAALGHRGRRDGLAVGGEGGEGEEEDGAGPARRVMSQQLPLNLPGQLEEAGLGFSLESLLEDIRAKARAMLSEGGEEGLPLSPASPPSPAVALPAAASLPVSADAPPAAVQPPVMNGLSAAAASTPAAAAVVAAIPVAKSSRYQGVCLCRSNRSRWQAQVTFKRRRHYLGMHESEEAAARAYDQGAICLLGAGAQTNFPLADYDVASLAALDIADVAARLKALSRGDGGSGRRAPAPGGKRARRVARSAPAPAGLNSDSEETEEETETESEGDSE